MEAIKKRLVLLGGGHAHVFVLKALGNHPIPGVDVMLIAKELEAPYSGMLPGFVAGHYRLDECQIDLERLAQFARARVLEASAVGIDRINRRVHIAGRESVPYDVLSINVGITPDLSGIDGAGQHALAVKPVSEFAPKWQALEERARSPSGPRRIVVVGGGAAGVELILAARHRLGSDGPPPIKSAEPFTFSLVTGGTILPSHSDRARNIARTALREAGVKVFEHDSAVAITADTVRLRSGPTLPCDAAIVSTRAQAPAWLAATGLARDAGGFIALRPTLQTYTDDDIFAAGDCATVIEHPRPKAGVFAVRQGPVLADHLRRHLQQQLLDPMIPQRHFLTLVSLGGRTAIADRNGMAAAGRWAWHWKDWIDRRFMAQFSNL